MKRSPTVLLVILFGLLISIGGCSKNQSEQDKQTQQSFTQAPPTGSSLPMAAGMGWTVPKRWATEPARQMRVATYGIPIAQGDTDAGECAVFYFGSGQGGDVETNISRWVSQFENVQKPERSEREVNGMHVTLVRIAGTYLAPGGPMMQSQGKRDNYRLLGAIVAAPEGSVFFKLTGPAKTVSAAENEFEEMIGSISKQKQAAS